VAQLVVVSTSSTFSHLDLDHPGELLLWSSSSLAGPVVAIRVLKIIPTVSKTNVLMGHVVREPESCGLKFFFPFRFIFALVRCLKSSSEGRVFAG
jgi:hypothetical protein